MAKIKDVYELTSKANLSGLKDAVKAIEGQGDAIKDLGSKAKDAAKGGVAALESGLGKLKSAAKTGAKVLGALSLAGGVALVGALGAGFKAFGDINSAMNQLSAQTGVTGEELGALRQVSLDVFRQGLGEDIGAVTDALATARQQFRELGTEDLGVVTKNALILQDVFDKDVGESMRTARQLTTGFGLDAQQAFDLITGGMQMGGDRADDLLDTLNEYGPLFSQMGFKADDMLSYLVSGLDAGAFNTDKVADGIKELSVRLTEGGDDISDVFGQMGMDFGGITDSIRAGEEQWGDYIPNVIAGLRQMEDPIKRNQAGIKLFGSAWEDLGSDVILALEPGLASLDDLEGATEAAGDTLNKDLGRQFTRLKRTVLTSLGEAVGPFASELIDKLIPYIEIAADWLGENLPVALDYLSQGLEMIMPILATLWGWIGEQLPGAISTLQSIFGGIVAWVTTNFPAIRDTIVGTIQSILEIVGPIADAIFQKLAQFWEEIGPKLIEAWNGIVAAVGPALEAISNFVHSHMDDITQVIGGAMSVITGVIEAGIGIIRGLIEFLAAIISGDWTAAWEAAKNVTQSVWDGIGSIIEGALDIIGGLLGLLEDALKAPWTALTGLVQGVIDGVKNLLETGINAVINFINSLIGGYNDTIGRIPGAPHIGKLPLVSLAEGGIVDSPTLAVVGDAPAPEVVAPLDDLVGILQQAMGGAGGGTLAGAVINVNVSVSPGGFATPEEAGQRAGDAFVDALRGRGIRP